MGVSFWIVNGLNIKVILLNIIQKSSLPHGCSVQHEFYKEFQSIFHKGRDIEKDAVRAEFSDEKVYGGLKGRLTILIQDVL